MKKDHKPIALVDLGLKPEEVKELVEGAQKFLPPMADPADEEPLDSGEKKPIS